MIHGDFPSLPRIERDSAVVVGLRPWVEAVVIGLVGVHPAAAPLLGAVELGQVVGLAVAVLCRVNLRADHAGKLWMRGSGQIIPAKPAPVRVLMVERWWRKAALHPAEEQPVVDARVLVVVDLGDWPRWSPADFLARLPARSLFWRLSALDVAARAFPFVAVVALQEQIAWPRCRDQ